MLVDRQGYIWFGTLEGLVRHDGYSSTVFNAKPGDSLSLQGNLIYDLCEDHNGFIWVATVGGGVSRFDPRTEAFHSYKSVRTDQSSLSHNQVYALHEDRRGRLWVGTLRGLDLYVPSDDCFRRIFPPPGECPFVKYRQVTSLAEDLSGSGGLWIGTLGHGVFLLDSTGTRVTPLTVQGHDLTVLSKGNVPFLHQDSSDPEILWIGTSDAGLYRYDIRRDKMSNFRHDPSNPRSLSSNYARCMLRDRSGMLWVGTGGKGLNRFDPTSGTFTRYQHDPRDSRSLISNSIISLFQDASGLYWVGTRTGICTYVNPWEEFAVHRNEPGLKNCLSDNFLWGMCEDREGMLWISSGGGLNRLDLTTGRYSCYRHVSDEPGSLRSDAVRTIAEDRKGRLWVGTGRGILHLFDRSSGHAKALYLDSSQTTRFGVEAILEDVNGLLWVGTERGLFAVDVDTWTARSISIGSLKTDLSIQNQINSLFEDPSHAIWIGTLAYGMIKYDPRSQDTTVYLHGVLGNRRERLGSINYIGRDRSGQLWTAGTNLCRYLGDVDQFEIVPLDTDERQVGSYGFLEDGSGNFWISTASGLLRYVPGTGSVKRFTVDDGLPADEFNSRSFCVSRSGRMYFGTVNGMISFHPDSIRVNGHAPPVVITKLRIFERELKTDTSLAFISGVVLPHDRNFLSFEYSALDFRSPQYNTFAYRLEGLDADWIPAGNRRYVSYSDLAPGRYVLRVKASNNDGVWNERAASLAITIQPPWWGTWWFRGLILAVIAASAYGVYRYQLSRVLAMGRMRIRIADDLHDDIGSDLSAIALESDLIARHLDHAERERQRVLEVARSIRDAADKLRDVVWIVNPDQDKLEDLKERMREVTRVMLKGMDVSITTGDGVRTRTLDMELKRNILLMFKEILNNIVRHANATRVTIRLEDTEDSLHVSVEDNGRGFDVGAAASGRGFKSLSSRAEAIGGAFSVESTPGIGTKACFKTRIAHSWD